MPVLEAFGGAVPVSASASAPVSVPARGAALSFAFFLAAAGIFPAPVSVPARGAALSFAFFLAAAGIFPAPVPAFGVAAFGVAAPVPAFGVAFPYICLRHLKKIKNRPTYIFPFKEPYGKNNRLKQMEDSYCLGGLGLGSGLTFA